jgi:hypothetical protein
LPSNQSLEPTALALAVPLSRFTSRVGSGSTFHVRHYMKLATLFVFATVTFVGCSTPEGRRRSEILQHRQYLEEQAQTITVNTSDGISEVEAYKIGRDRFDTYRSSCGIVTTPADLGDYWRVTTCVGYAGMPFEDILIRKADGSTTIKKADVEHVPNKPPEPTAVGAGSSVSRSTP